MDDKSRQTLGRRQLFAGAATAGALVAAATLVPAAKNGQPQAPAAGAAPKEDGYRLTAHIQRYYDTARV